MTIHANARWRLTHTQPAVARNGAFLGRPLVKRPHRLPELGKAE
jgi:hypothetical protein